MADDKQKQLTIWGRANSVNVQKVLWCLHELDLAYEVDDIYATCDRLMKMGITINRPPRDGNMAFVRSPDKHSIEILQKGSALSPKEPWTSMPNTGHW